VLTVSEKSFLAELVPYPLFVDQLHLPGRPDSWVCDDVQPHHPAYIIYTSGTTGPPKGLCIAHENVLVYLTGMSPLYRIMQKDRILQGFSVSSDASIEEIWMAFLEGATLVVGTTEVMLSIEEFAANLRRLRISVLSTVSTMLSACNLSMEVPNLRLVIGGGEPIDGDTINKWWRPWRRLISTYGATECSVVASYCECSPNKLVEIGKPVPGYSLLILNRERQPIAITTDASWKRASEEGELAIGGMAVSSYGYLNQPEENADKFLTYQNGMRAYRTGDLVKLSAKGKLIFVGRIDEQTKATTEKASAVSQ